MAFGRSASGPGGLSINTGSGNSLFGSNTSNTTQPQPAAGLFGSTASAATSQPQQSSSLFGAAASRPGGMFGSTATSTAQPASGGLFGSQPATSGGAGLFGASTVTSQPQQTGGLFGSLGAQSQPQQTGGLFGATATQQQQTGGVFGSTLQPPQAQQPSGGLFGSLGTQQTPQSQPQQTSSLFGSTLGQNQQSNTGGGLFGSLGQPQNQTQAPQGSLFGGFGNSTVNKQNNVSTLFNQANNQAANPTPSLGLFSTNQANQQQMSTPFPQSQPLQSMVPGVKIDLSNLRPTTRFSDLHESLQAEITALDELILTQQQHAQQVSSFMTNHAEALTHLPNDTELLTHRLATLTSALENDALAISHVRETTASDAADARLSFRAVDNLKLPPQYHHHPAAHSSTSTSLHWNGGVSSTPAVAATSTATAAVDHPTSSFSSLSATDDASSPKDLVQYFSARASAMALALENYSRTVAAIESHLRGVEARTAQQTQQLLLAQSQGASRNASDGVIGGDASGRSADEQVRQLAAVLRDFESGILGVAGKVGGAREAVQELVLGSEGR